MSDEKRTLLAIFLCVLVIIFYGQFVIQPQARRAAPKQPLTQQPTNVAQPPSVTNTIQSATVPAISTQPIPQAILTQLPPTVEELRAAPKTVIDSPTVSLTITHLGGRVSSYKLKRYTKKLGEKEPLDLISVDPTSSLPFGVYTGGISDERVAYTLEGATAGVNKDGDTFTVSQNSDLSLKLSGVLPNGTKITKTFTFHPDSYLFELSVELNNPSADGSPVWVEWTQYSPDDKYRSYEQEMFALLGKEDNKITQIHTPAIKVDGGTDGGSNLWASLATRYFMATIIPSVPGANTQTGRRGNMFFVRARGETTSGKFSVYVGPKDVRVLNDVGHQLNRSIDLGTFAFLATPLLELIRLLHDILGNYGLAIILLTLLIKIAFFPLNRASFKSMAAMQELQPEMKALRERVKDPTQLNQEIMALYKRKGVNPMGGCFPIMIQIPVFLGLYNALSQAIELRHAPFALWINDLSAPESLNVLGIPIPVMVLLMGASMFIQQWMTPTPDPQQRKIMMFMPIIFTFMFITGNFPAGLVLYWLVNNIISIIQQSSLKGTKHINPFATTLLASVGIFGFGFVLTLL